MIELMIPARRKDLGGFEVGCRACQSKRGHEFPRVFRAHHNRINRLAARCCASYEDSADSCGSFETGKPGACVPGWKKIAACDNTPSPQKVKVHKCSCRVRWARPSLRAKDGPTLTVSSTDRCGLHRSPLRCARSASRSQRRGGPLAMMRRH